MMRGQQNIKRNISFIYAKAGGCHILEYNFPGHGCENIRYELCVNSARFGSLKNYGRQGRRLFADGEDKTSEVEGKKLRTVDEGRYL
jgi:hypothetical protein